MNCGITSPGEIRVTGVLDEGSSAFCQKIRRTLGNQGHTIEQVPLQELLLPVIQVVSNRQAKQFLLKSSFEIAQEQTEQKLRINFSLEIEQLMKKFLVKETVLLLVVFHPYINKSLFERQFAFKISNNYFLIYNSFISQGSF